MGKWSQFGTICALVLMSKWATANQKEVVKSFAVGKNICQSMGRQSETAISCQKHLDQVFKTAMPPAPVLAKELCALESEASLINRCLLRAAREMSKQNLTSQDFANDLVQCEKIGGGSRSSARAERAQTRLATCLGNAYSREITVAQSKSCERGLSFMHDGLLKYNPLGKSDAESIQLQELWKEHIFCDFSAASNCDPKKLTGADRALVKSCLPVFGKMKTGRDVQMGIDYITKAMGSVSGTPVSEPPSQKSPPVVR